MGNFCFMLSWVQLKPRHTLILYSLNSSLGTFFLACGSSVKMGEGKEVFTHKMVRKMKETEKSFQGILSKNVIFIQKVKNYLLLNA